MRRDDLHKSPGEQLGEIIADAKSLAAAGQTSPSGDIHIRPEHDLTFAGFDADGAYTKSIRDLDAAQSELERLLEQAETDLAQGRLDIAQAKADIKAAADGLKAAMSEAQQARADAEAASGLASAATQAAQDAWNNSVTASDQARVDAIREAETLAANATSTAVAQAAADRATAIRDALNQAAADAKSKADAAEQAATTAATAAAAADAAAKAATAEANAKAAAATDAQSRADAAAAKAKADALTAAATDAQTKATKAKNDAIAAMDQKLADQSTALTAAQQAAQAALTAAEAAQATADGSISTYYQQNPPWADGTDKGLKVAGDLWYDTDDNLAYRWDATAKKWQPIRDTAIGTALATAQSAQTTADGKIDSFYQPGMPTTGGVGDLWFDTDDGNKPYYCTKAAPNPTWTLVQDNNLKALAAADATAKADAAKAAAISAAQADAKSKADAAQAAATSAAAADAAAKAATAEANAKTAAALDAKAKADAAQQAAITASASDAQTKADAAKAAAQTAAAADAAAKAATAEANAKTAAAADAKSKADAAQAAAIAAAKAADAVLKAQIDSRGTDLVTNGTGMLGDNTNFSWATVDKINPPPGASASFASSAGANQQVMIDESIPFDPGKSYRFSWQMRQTVAGSTNVAYGFLAPFDALGNLIAPQNYCYWAATTTTLTTDLKPGDTTVQLASTANWFGTSSSPAGASTHWRSMIIWGYTDANGKMWPEHTYSRRYWAADLWADGGINGNVITLRTPWPTSAGTIPAGTKVSNGSSGGSYLYAPSATAVVVPEAWKAYADTFSAGSMPAADQATPRNAPANWNTGMPPGTAKVKVGWLLNYPGGAIAGRHAVGAVSFSDASAAQATATAALTSANGRNSRIISTGLATGTTNPTTGNPLVKGDTWWQWDSTTARNVIGAWCWDGVQWLPEKITDQVIASLDVNKLVVTGSARMAQAVVEKIIADAAYVGALTVDRLSAGTAAMGTAVAQKIAAATGTFIEAAVEKLVVTGSATIDTAVLKKIAAGTAAFQQVYVDNLVARSGTIDSAVIRQLAAQMVAADVIVAGNPTGARVTLNSNGLTTYNTAGQVVTRLGTSDDVISVGERYAGLGRYGATLGWVANVGGKPVYGLSMTTPSTTSGLSNAAVYSGGAGEVTLSAGSTTGGPQYKATVTPTEFRAGYADQTTQFRVDTDGLWAGEFRLTPKEVSTGDRSSLGPGYWYVKGGVTSMPTSNWGLLEIRRMWQIDHYNWFYLYRDDLGTGVWTCVFGNKVWTPWVNLMAPDPTNRSSNVTWGGGSGGEVSLSIDGGKHVDFALAARKTNQDVVCTLPAEVRPWRNIAFAAIDEGTGAPRKAWVDASTGNVVLPNGANVTVSITAGWRAN